MSLFKHNLAKKGKDIVIVERNMDIFNGNPRETFSNPIKVRSLIKTLSGISVFDNTNTERVATHQFCIDYRDDITSEQWIQFNNKNIRILTTENKCENNELLILVCTERGTDSLVSNDA